MPITGVDSHDPDAPVTTFAPKIPPGAHACVIVRALTKRKDGSLYTTKDGHRKVSVVIANRDGNEAFYDAPIEGPRSGMFLSLLKAVGLSDAALATLNAEDFLSQEVADRYLVGKPVAATVEQSGAFLNVRLKRPAGAAPAAPSAVAPKTEVPFSWTTQNPSAPDRPRNRGRARRFRRTPTSRSRLST